MRSFFIGTIIFLNFFRCFPHLVVLYFHKNRSVIQADILRWLQFVRINLKGSVGFIYLLAFYPEFRNLFYNRIGLAGHFLNIFCRKLQTLYLNTKQIGEGLVISHGYATGISAKSIGKNCLIYQQVAIGNYRGFPTILDNVTIYTGAIIIGQITIGNNSIIGANATVFQDVPDNCTVLPAASKIIRWKNGIDPEEEKNENQVLPTDEQFNTIL